MYRPLVVVASVAAAVSSVQGFSPFRPAAAAAANANKAAKNSAMADEAVAIFARRYPKKPPQKRLFFESWGVPARDVVDGTEIKRAPSSSSSTSSSGEDGTDGTTRGRSLFDVDESRQRSAFAELSRVYGEEVALDMVRDVPGVLAFDSSNFEPAFMAWTGVFGEEGARGMVRRNPNLLAVAADEAENSTDQTMRFSYVLSATRPVGPFITWGIIALLLLPAVEQVTGVPIRARLLGDAFYGIPTLPPDAVFGS